MKYSKKQLAWSAIKIQERFRSVMLTMFSLVMTLLFVLAVGFAFVNPEGSALVVKMGMPFLILMSMANIGNIDQPSGRDTAASQIGFKLWLVAREQIDDTVVFPTPNANRELGDVPLKAGEYMHYFEGIENSLKYTGTGEQGDVTPTFGKTIPIFIKYSKAALNFVEEYLQKGFILIWSECESADKEVVGSFCKPVMLTNFEVKNDGDGKYISLTFGNTHWRQPLTYTGNIATEAPTVVAAGSTNLAIGTNNTYQLTAGAAVIATVSGLASADYGRYITILAPAAGVAPTIADNAVFVLRDGTTWTAKPGSRIVFQILDSATLVEVSRIQTA
ncbi:MAG: hypothetical protein AB2L24_21810 [Mangrovibacterium sp.]